MFIIPSLVLWCVVYPAVIIGIMAWLWRKRRLSDQQNLMVFGFLINGYWHSTFYWEFCKIFLRLVMVFSYQLMSV